MATATMHYVTKLPEGYSASKLIEIVKHWFEILHFEAELKKGRIIRVTMVLLVFKHKFWFCIVQLVFLISFVPFILQGVMSISNFG